ncbi:hypothetical protein [Actinoplanes sp. DH11]|uniref:hypothetical protein n=1 Tax=Actinoplanes sp. DH11 TaxID=2857011 RepID=UPI001E4DB261|nr:hypothetical protein [Actinoplanes sp. DH11]
MALLLDLANILGGLLLAVPLLRSLPTVGTPLGRLTDKISPWAWLVGVLALVTGGYYLLVHLFSGPHLFHFEVVGLAVGVILLWDRLTGRHTPTTPAPGLAPASSAPGGPSAGGSAPGGSGAGGSAPGGSTPGGSAPGGSGPGGGPGPAASVSAPGGQGVLAGRTLILAIFGVIAIVVGLQGFFTPN